MVTIKINGQDRMYEEGIKYEIIANEWQKDYSDRIALVVEDGKIRELMKRVTKDCELEFLTIKDTSGHKAYVRSAIMIMLKAIKDVIDIDTAVKTKVEFCVGTGYFCRKNDGTEFTAEQVSAIKERMNSIIEADLPFTKKSYAAGDAMRIFESQGMTDKVKLFRYRRSSFINVYCLGDFYDYFYGYMLPSTSYIKWFDVIPYEKGIMLVLPERSTPTVQPETYVERPKIFETMIETTKWGLDAGVDTVGDLNEQICESDVAEMMLVQEAFQERRIAEIASDIASRSGVKFVMIAGPSSSGKTSFSHRLSIQLRTHGLKPHPIGLDNYYKNREFCPKDEDGNYDFECLESIDVEQFNEDMTKLRNGEAVDLPRFNFKTGKREYQNRPLKLGEEDILVIEGIHGLNEKMSHSLPADCKYKIYISALTCLNIDEHNRIPTTDSRLLRRIVRDARTRGTDAASTIRMWPSVRRGEEKYIFPFQEEADAVFNSAMIYESSILKTFAEPLLFGIKKGEPEYVEAKRLLKFLEYFLGVSSELLPNNSIIREFVGGSCFDV